MPSELHLHLAARTIESGGIVAYPTEAVYGLGCDPRNAAAVIQLLRIKQRPFTAGLILVASDISLLLPYTAGLSTQQQRRISEQDAGPVSWVVPAALSTPYWITGERDTVAIRVTSHPVAAALSNKLDDALVSTSANISGRRPARSALQVRQQLGNTVEYILNGPVGDAQRPSTIRELSTGRVLR